MQIALNVFELCMQRVRALHALQGVLATQVPSAMDTTDILRAEVVLAVSALDYFVHELTRLGMCECWVGARPKTDAFGRYALPISMIGNLLGSETAHEALNAEIRNRHSFKAFQHPDKIAEAIRLFSSVKLWEEVGAILERPPQDLKRSLALIVERRNKIAHEADIDPSYPEQRWPIDADMVQGIFDEIEAIARAIFTVAV
jgi:hypothetical protein